MGRDVDQTIFFYNQHPISAEIILAKLKESRGHLIGVRPDELFPYDQDHYGSLAASDELARGAAVVKDSRVADFCAGLGGPARYFAHQYGADVTGIELTPARVAGAAALTRLVGLQERVRVIEGNVTAVPLDDGTIDAVIGQEAWLHISDRRAMLGEAYRILKRGGRLAFTDWVAHQPLAAADVDLLWEGQAVQPLETPSSYRDLLAEILFQVVSSEDLTLQWAPILRERLTMYQRLRKDAETAGTPSGHDAFHRSYVRFVDLVQQRILGGVRIVASK
jgi:ubiquinone/menaquinone biosynthesis C-methylase UbiE